MMLKTLILGYGNPDREDDGVAWHVLQKLAHHFNRPIMTVDSLEFDHQRGGDEEDQVDKGSVYHHPNLSPYLAFALQLTPEMAEVLAHFDRVCFIDAHTGAFPEEIRVAPIEAGYQASSFTHHLTPESCLGLAKTLYSRAPSGLLVSIRGYCFGFGVELSEQTAPLVDLAVTQIVDWTAQTDAR